jgi:hypothetical protein
MPSGERFKCHSVRTRVVPFGLWRRWKRPLSTAHLWQMSINEVTDGRDASAPSGVV